MILDLRTLAVLCLVSSNIQAADPGRLFFTPAERQLLERGINPWQAPLNGEIRTSDQRRLWQFDDAWQAATAPMNLRVGDRPGEPLLPPGSLQVLPGKRVQ